MPLVVYVAKSPGLVAATALLLTAAKGMMLPTPDPPVPKYWKPLAEKVPALPLVAVRPLPKRTLLAAVPRGLALAVPPTKFTVAPVLRARAALVNRDVAPADGVAGKPA